MRYLIIGLIIIFGGLLLMFPNKKAEEVEEYEFIEVGEYRVLHPSVHKLLEDYTEQRGINHKMPIVDGDRSYDGHFRGKTFDETGRLSIFVNADDTVNSVEYMGENFLMLHEIIELFGIDNNNEDVYEFLRAIGESNRNDVAHSGEVNYKGITLSFSKGNSLYFVNVYGKQM